MAHLRKFTLAESGHMFAHYARTPKKYANSDVDSSKSHQNYNMAPDRPQMDHLKKLLAEVDHKERKDLVTMFDWIVQVPQDLSEDMYDTFFKLVYQFSVDRYGKQSGLPNPEDAVISAYCHFDETTPHCHLAFAPITMVDGIPRFLAKQL